MFQFTFGDVGSGKSLRQAKIVLELLRLSEYRYKNWKKLGWEIQPEKREVWCNFHMNPIIQERYKDILHTWHLPQEMIFDDYPQNHSYRKNFDLVWDEMAVEIPADKWKDTDPAIRALFAQHRKRGIDIYGNTQDYKMLDVNARRMATEVYQTLKVLGNRDPSATKPPLRRFWGLIIAWHLDKNFIKASEGMEVKVKHEDFFPEFVWINKDLCQSYDTTEDIKKTEKAKLQHIEFFCDKCRKVEVKHVPV